MLTKKFFEVRPQQISTLDKTALSEDAVVWSFNRRASEICLINAFSRRNEGNNHTNGGD